MTVRTFRRLLILSVVLPVVGVLVSMATQDRLPSPLREYTLGQSAVIPSTQALVGCLILLTASIAAVVGLYRFKPFGRRLFFVTLVVGFVLTPVFGPWIDSGWDNYSTNPALRSMEYCWR